MWPIENSTSDDGSYWWTIPQDQMPADGYRIRIRCLDDETCYDVSDENFRITPVVVDCSLAGDVDGNGAVTPGDAQAAFDHYLGVASAAQPECADVCPGWPNGNGSITPGDAQGIFNRYLGASPYCGTKSARKHAALELEVGPASWPTDETVEVPLYVRGACGLDSFGGVVRYDADKLHFVHALPGGAVADWMLVAGREAAPGEAIVGGMAGAGTPLTGVGTLLLLVFECSVDAAETSPAIRLTDLADGWEGATVVGGGAAPMGQEEGAGELESRLHSGDFTGDGAIGLTELLRVVQLYNAGGYHCAANPGDTVDGYGPGPDGDKTCAPHASDYSPDAPDWTITMTELLRFIQFYNAEGYQACSPELAEDGFCPVSE